MIPSRSPIVGLGIQAATPFAIVVGTYLLFAGHNQPGGGFAAGLVFGAVVALRTVADLQRPRHGNALIVGGLVVVVLDAVAPVLWGDPLLDQQVFSGELPLFGKIKVGSALPYDIGVTAIVIGLVIALLDGLGGSADATVSGGAGQESDA